MPNKPLLNTPTQPTPNPAPSGSDGFTSPDGLVKVRIKTDLRRWPPHKYPCVVLEVHPRRGTRVQALANGGVEVMFRHSEIRALLAAVNAAAGQELYVAKDIPDKPEARRLLWYVINAQRHAGRRAGRN